MKIYHLIEPSKKNENEEFKDTENYINLALNGTKIDKDKIHYSSKTPKISVVVSIYNGEAFLNTILLSIQNQDLKDLEIIMIDDYSKDNSVKLIKQFKKTEPRIVLHENKENKDALYTKTKGVLLAKGKYILVFDEDIYLFKEMLLVLYI